MCINPLRDDDGDGYPAAFVRSGGAWVACGGTDCNDSNAAIHPGAPEVCGNSTDDNCNGTVDEGCARAGDVCATAIPISLSGGSATIIRPIRCAVREWVDAMSSTISTSTASAT